MPYSNLATAAMRKAAAQIESQKVQTTNRMLDEIGLTFDWGQSISSSSEPIFSIYINPNNERIPETSEESELESLKRTRFQKTSIICHVTKGTNFSSA